MLQAEDVSFIDLFISSVQFTALTVTNWKILVLVRYFMDFIVNFLMKKSEC